MGKIRKREKGEPSALTVAGMCVMSFAPFVALGGYIAGDIWLSGVAVFAAFAGFCVQLPYSMDWFDGAYDRDEDMTIDIDIEKKSQDS